MSDDQGAAMNTGDRGRAVEGWFPLVAGLVWLMSGIGNGGVALLVALAPGVLLTATGAAELLFSGDRRIVQFAALGAAGGVLFAVIEMMLVGFGTGPSIEATCSTPPSGLQICLAPFLRLLRIDEGSPGTQGATEMRRSSSLVKLCATTIGKSSLFSTMRNLLALRPSHLT